jgi:hypothetical protein
MFTVDIEDNELLADEITTLSGQINAANYRFLKLVAEFDKREAWSGFGIRSCAHWLNWQCGIALNAAREKVRVARALDGLPKINQAFEKGELSFSKVRAMTRAATKENEAYLLMIANHGTAQHMEVLIRAYRGVSHLTDNEVENNRYASEKKSDEYQKEQRKVSCFQDDDGMWHIQAQLPAEEGGFLVKVLKELGDRLVAESSADAILEAQPSIVNTDGVNSAESVTAVTSFPQRRADALVAIAEYYLAANTSDITGLKASERCQLVMHVHTGANSFVNKNTNLDGQWLAPDAARRLACDASLVVVSEDEKGNVLDIGRRSRVIPPAMSRALSIRDGGCQFPGCCESRYVEGHHIKHWADGGETKLDNLVTLCRYHHRELHKGNYFLCVKPTNDKVERFADRLCFSKGSSADKQVIAANSAQFSCACCDSAVLEKSLPADVYQKINAKTAVTNWLGERMDLSMAIDGLIYKRAAAQDVGIGMGKQGSL